MILKNPTTAPRIVPYQQPRLATDVMRDGSLALRVTQPFKTGIHDGLDLANFECGDMLLASVSGTVQNRIDSFGALIAEIYLPDRSGCGYGHLRAYGRPDGATVKAGEVIGYIGRTGKVVDGCHVHYSAWDEPFHEIDPWPLLEQNQITELPDTGTDFDMYEWVPEIGHQVPKIALVKQGTRLLKNPNGTLHFVLPNDQRCEVIGGIIDGKHFWVGRRAPSGSGLFLIPDEAVISWPKG